MKQKELTCRLCGKSFPVDPASLPSFCPHCGQ